MTLTVNKKTYGIELWIGLDTEESFRAFRQILRQWIDDHSGNSSSVTHQNAKSMARELLHVLQE